MEDIPLLDYDHHISLPVAVAEVLGLACWVRVPQVRYLDSCALFPTASIPSVCCFPLFFASCFGSFEVCLGDEARADGTGGDGGDCVVGHVNVISDNERDKQAPIWDTLSCVCFAKGRV